MAQPTVGGIPTSLGTINGERVSGIAEVHPTREILTSADSPVTIESALYFTASFSSDFEGSVNGAAWDMSADPADPADFPVTAAPGNILPDYEIIITAGTVKLWAAFASE